MTAFAQPTISGQRDTVNMFAGKAFDFFQMNRAKTTLNAMLDLIASGGGGAGTPGGSSGDFQLNNAGNFAAAPMSSDGTLINATLKIRQTGNFNREHKVSSDANALYGDVFLNSSGTIVGGFQVNRADGEVRIGGYTAGHRLTFWSWGAEVMRLQAGGELSIGGTVNHGEKLQVNGQGWFSSWINAEGGIFNGAGTYHNWGSTVGSSGYGLRDNAGSIEFKNNGGSWATFGDVTQTGTQTLTNKTLTAPQVNSPKLNTSSTVGHVWTATSTDGSGTWQTLNLPTSGDFTSTLTSVTNVSSSTAYEGQYTRIGDVVTYSFKVDVTTTGAGASELGVSTPTGSNSFAANGKASGNGSTNDGVSGSLSGDNSNNRFSFQFNSPSAGSYTFFCTVTYKVVLP